MKLIKENIPFTMVANEILKSTDLSFKAKGMYAYLFSKPDEWDFSSNRMTLESKEGRKSIMAMLRELETAGYLKRSRLPDGRMEYNLKYSNKSLSPESSLRLEKPKSRNGTVPIRPSAISSPVSNTYNPSNKEEKVISNSDCKSHEVFSFKEEIKKLEDNPRRDLNIIALYLEEKKPDIRTREQLSVAIKRHLRGAKQLCPFTDTQIIDSIPKARKSTSEYTLETLVKILTK